MEYVVQYGLEMAQKEIHEQILKRHRETLDTNRKNQKQNEQNSPNTTANKCNSQ
jgi:hypothetical protein